MVQPSVPPRPVPRGRKRRHAVAVAVTAALALVTVFAVGQLSKAPPPSPPPVAQPDEVLRADNARALGAGLKLVNYYPRDRAWEQQWTKFSPTVTSTDFAVIRNLGATSVRIIVFPKVLGFPRPDAAEQAKLRTTIELADAAGLRVWLTLFDNFSTYTDLEGSRTWTTALLTPYAGDSRIEAVEIRNEIKPTSAAMTWAQDQIALVHRLLPPMPVTISMNGAIDPAAYGTMLVALNPESPDLISYHYYGDSGLAYDHFRRVIAAAGTIPVVIGEAGLSTAPLEARCPDQACREAEQVDWYQIAVAAARQAGLAPPAPWTVFDLTPDATDRPIVAAGYGYGLYRVDGSAKPAAAVMADAFADRWTTAPQNIDFSETTLQGARARAWVPWRSSGSIRVDNENGMAGYAALVMTGTETLADGQTSWYARPVRPVQAGQSWRIRVNALSLNASATGTTTIAVAWYDGEGEYLGIDTSPKLANGIVGWQELTVVGTPRPGAGAARIHLRSAGNSGTVYFSNPGWTVTPT